MNARLLFVATEEERRLANLTLAEIAENNHPVFEMNKHCFGKSLGATDAAPLGAWSWNWMG